MATRRVIKNLKVALKDFEGMVKDPKWIQKGREIQNFSLRPREAWGNWLLCAVLQKVQNTKDITFGEGTENDDGIILDEKTGGTVITEHVSAMEVPSGKPIPKGEARIINAINLKIKRGAEYAKDKFLIVFFDGAETWYRNKIRESINGKHNFKRIFLIGLMTIDKINGYAYSVTELYENHSISFKVQINYDFTDYTVTKLNGEIVSTPMESTEID